MSETTEAFWVPHCDDPPCDLGGFEYTCPACGKGSTDYEVWWLWDDVWHGKLVPFNCEKCHAPLIAFYDHNEYETRVRVRLQPEQQAAERPG